jgi:hypothetical protein
MIAMGLAFGLVHTITAGLRTAMATALMLLTTLGTSNHLEILWLSNNIMD